MRILFQIFLKKFTEFRIEYRKHSITLNLSLSYKKSKNFEQKITILSEYFEISMSGQNKLYST
jgi:hypothetical protein